MAQLQVEIDQIEGQPKNLVSEDQHDFQQEIAVEVSKMKKQDKSFQEIGRVLRQKIKRRQEKIQTIQQAQQQIPDLESEILIIGVMLKKESDKFHAEKEAKKQALRDLQKQQADLEKQQKELDKKAVAMGIKRVICLILVV